MKKAFVGILSLVLIVFVGCTAKEQFPLDKIVMAEAVESEVIVLNDGDKYTMEANLVKKDIAGRNLTMYAYNSSVPGPLIKVKQGSEIFVNFKNNTDIENTIHPHGIRVDNPFDGIPGVTQEPVEPGESFEYRLKFSDPGVYWYHPHVREDLTQELGMYGNIVVEPEDSDYWNEVDAEEFLFIDDILLGKNDVVPFDDERINHALMGRYGNVMLVNGETDYELTVQKNETVRFAMTSSANARTFNLLIDGTPLKLVGADGGRYENESMVESVLLSPSERIIFETNFDKVGTYKLLHKTPDREYMLGEIKVVDSETAEVADFSELRTFNDIEIVLPDLESYYAKAPDKILRLDVEVDGMMGGMNHSGMRMDMSHDQGKIEWEDDMGMMNSMLTDAFVNWQLVDEETGLNGGDVNWKFNKGDLVKIRIYNDPNTDHPMQHPIHFHGQRFVVLSTNDERNENMVFKDTTLVKTGDTVDILVEMSNPGDWMGHCHIAEHLHSGMMLNFSVE